MQKITLTSSTRECITKGTFLGYEGENEVNKLVFEFTDGFKDGLGVLNIQRGEEYGYVSLEKVEGAYEFPVKNSILSKIGDIRFQVVITGNDGSVIKYDPFTMTVKDAIDAESEMPEEYPSWVDMANAKLAEVDEAIRNTEVATKNAEDVANNILEAKANGEFNGKDGEDGKDGKDGVVGKDGISPTVVTEQTETGAKISITDVNGTHTAEVLNGKDGKDGENGKDGKDGTMSFEELTEEQKASLKGDKGDKGDTGATGEAGKDGTNGADGFSPTATVSQTETGAIISVTDANGTTTAEIFNGKDGEDGSGGIAELPIATSDILGGIKVGDGLVITEEGVLSAINTPGGTECEGSGYTETELLNAPAEYALRSNSANVLNQKLVLNDDTTKFDVIVFVSDVKNTSGLYLNAVQQSFLVGEIKYNSASSYADVKDGSTFNLINVWNGGTSTTFASVMVHFQDTKTLNVGFTAINNASYNSFRIRSIKGIKLGASGGTNNGDTTPIGSVIAHIGMTAPEGYLACDGAELNIADYTDLATHFETQFGAKNHFGGDGVTTFAVPDMRNEFLRGYHGDAIEQLSGEIGEHQDATAHISMYTSYAYRQIQVRMDTTDVGYAKNVDSEITQTPSHNLNNLQSSQQVDDGTPIASYYTSRPTNVAVLYCIKYKATAGEGGSSTATREYGSFEINIPSTTVAGTELVLTPKTTNMTLADNGRIILKANKTYLIRSACRHINFSASSGFCGFGINGKDGTEITRLANYCSISHTGNQYSGSSEYIALFDEDTEIYLGIVEWSNVSKTFDMVLTITEL